MNPSSTCKTYTVPLSPATLTHHRSPQDLQLVSRCTASASFSSSKNLRIPPAKVKIKIAPSVNIVSPPFPQGASGRKVEQIADVVVEFGGRVLINVDIDTGGLEQLDWGGGEWERGVGEKVKEMLGRVFDANKEKLALVRVAHDSADNAITLSPMTGHTSGSAALDTLLVTGKPTVVLERIDLSISWEATEPAIDDGSETEDEGETRRLQSDPTTNPSQVLLQARDNLLILDDAVDGTDTGQDLPLEAQRSVLDVDGWTMRQLEAAMHKVIKVHLIRRFPLVFDGALIQYARTLRPHRSLTASLSRFLTLSQRHARPNASLATSALIALGQSQEAHVLAHARAATSVPHRYKPGPGIGRGKAKKKRKTESQGSEDSQGAKNAIVTDADPVEQRVNEHLERVALQMQAEEGEGVDMEVRVLDRLLRQGMGAVGRAKWEKGRMGMGRLAAHRIKLDRVADRASNPTPNAEPNVNTLPLYGDDDDMFFDLPLDEGEYSPDKTAQDGEMHGQSDDEAEEDDMDLLDWTEGDLSMDFDCDLELDLDIDMSPEESQTLSQDDTAEATNSGPHTAVTRSTSVTMMDEEDPFLLCPDDLLGPLLDLAENDTALEALQVQDDPAVNQFRDMDDMPRGALEVDSTGAACDVSVGSEEVPDDLLLGEDWNV